MGLDGVELVLAVEEPFGSGISDAEADAEAVKWLAARRFGEFGARFLKEEVEAALPEIIVEQLGIKAKQFDWAAEFVRDYGVD